MSDKETFIEEVESILQTGGYVLSEAAAAYFNKIKEGKSEKGLTENGLKILNSMYENASKYNNVFKAKDIGEILFLAPRSVSGSMKKLVSEGYCERMGKDPVCYSLTTKGMNLFVDNN